MKQRIFIGVTILLLAAVLNAQLSNESSPQQLGAQQQQPAKLVRISQGVAERLIVRKVEPDYPQEARKKHVQGSVLLQILISKSGDVSDVRVLYGDALLVPSAVAAVKQWTYKSYLLNGEPVAVETQLTINYRLKVGKSQP